LFHLSSLDFSFFFFPCGWCTTNIYHHNLPPPPPVFPYSIGFTLSLKVMHFLHKVVRVVDAPFPMYLEFCLSMFYPIHSLLIPLCHPLVISLSWGCLLLRDLFLNNPFPCQGDTLDCAPLDTVPGHSQNPLSNYPHQPLKVSVFQGLSVVVESIGFVVLTALPCHFHKII